MARSRSTAADWATGPFGTPAVAGARDCCRCRWTRATGRLAAVVDIVRTRRWAWRTRSRSWAFDVAGHSTGCHWRPLHRTAARTG